MGDIRLIKYKVGDKVRIKEGTIVLGYEETSKEYLSKNNYILTIYDTNKNRNSYSMDGWQGEWREHVIEGLYEEPIYEPIRSRFELLDL